LELLSVLYDVTMFSEREVRLIGMNLFWRDCQFSMSLLRANIVGRYKLAKWFATLDFCQVRGEKRKEWGR
jgi:hypothetical protein